MEVYGAIMECVSKPRTAAICSPSAHVLPCRPSCMAASAAGHNSAMARQACLAALVTADQDKAPNELFNNSGRVGGWHCQQLSTNAGRGVANSSTV